MMNAQPDVLAAGLSPAVQKTVIFDSVVKGDVNRARGYYTDAAGKVVNVSRVLVQSGMGVDTFLPAGRENLDEFRQLCLKDGLSLTAIEIRGRVRTCTTLVERDSGETTELVVNEPELVTPEEESLFLEQFTTQLERGYKGVIISGSRLPGFSEETIPRMVTALKKKGMVLFSDYRGTDLLGSFISPEIRPDYVKINDKEFMETFPGFSSLEEGMKEKSKEYGTAFIISRGEKSTLTAERGLISEIPSKKVEAVNPIGCGDAMTAGLARGILRGMILSEAVGLGRDYAALNAQSIHPGWIY